MKLSVLLKMILRTLNVLLVPCAVFIALATNNFLFPTILWSSSMGAEHTFRSIECSEKYSNKNKKYINTKRVYIFAYLGLIIVILGMFCVLNWPSFNIYHTTGLGLLILGFTVIAINDAINNAKSYNFVKNKSVLDFAKNN